MKKEKLWETIEPDLPLDTKHLKDIIKKLKSIDRIHSKKYEKIIFDVYSGEFYTTVELKGYRLETDEEFKKRKDKDKVYKILKNNEEKELYLKLRKIYEKE